MRLAVAAVVGPYVFEANMGTGAGGAMTALYVSVGSSGSNTGTDGAPIIVPYVKVGSVGIVANALGAAIAVLYVSAGSVGAGAITGAAMAVLYVSAGMAGAMAGNVGAAMAAA